ncbi:cAMP-binding domain of CRP or a regulatory subunit of cAMP-dependent protein kinases [Oscillibacter sp. PC13]|uniref:cyclic nucleotide-binding domain-containing protein n=1 Tax=Oscillibacter sp. PC13 TaxID=1855299 RepID=UPI0008F06D2B|nr:cyclic nucleotide-binding domain-containing protein [Oscillibacter sp. PC13]SFP25734.1 cAMP-binding domain of CRP or a regulatory subunit of cAMP-dependent protein kinases [Oscillibacter sp. PC13]
MRQINDSALLKSYIDRYNLQQNFSFDLTKAAILIQFDTDEMISRAGEMGQDFRILVNGECMAYDVTAGNKIHCECLYRGVNFLGFISVLWDEPVINNIRAVTPCTFLSISAVTYRGMLLNDLKFLQFGLRSLARHIRKNHTHFEPLKNRLATLILREERDGAFHYNLTVCADLLEVSYRHLLRTLLDLCNAGVLQKRKKGDYLIVDREYLYKLSSYGA